MEDFRSKMFTILGTIIVIIVFCVIVWLLFYQESAYYTQVDNANMEKLNSGDMRYEYTLNAYDKNGNMKEVTFKTSREVKEDAYLKLDVMMSRGVKAWEEVSYKELPSEVKEKYNK